MKVALCIMLVGLSSVPAAAAEPAAGPFGIAMGAPVSKLADAKTFKPGWYQVTAPEPDARFPRVAVEAFRATGVCVVQGVSALIGADPDGAKVRAAIDRLAGDYSQSLGQPEKLDSCKSMLCAPEFFGTDMLLNERHYGYRWRVRGALPKVREVSVVAVAHSENSFTYLVEYQSDDLTRCTARENTLD